MASVDVPPIAGVGTHTASSGIDWGAHLHPQVLADLVTDHAGEVGAVCIYQGVFRIARDPALRAFAQRHLATEQNHPRQIETWLPPDHYSHLLPVWRLAGFPSPSHAPKVPDWRFFRPHRAFSHLSRFVSIHLELRRLAPI